MIEGTLHSIKAFKEEWNEYLEYGIVTFLLLLLFFLFLY